MQTVVTIPYPTYYFWSHTGDFIFWGLVIIAFLLVIGGGSRDKY